MQSFTCYWLTLSLSLHLLSQMSEVEIHCIAFLPARGAVVVVRFCVVWTIGIFTNCNSHCVAWCELDILPLELLCSAFLERNWSPCYCRVWLCYCACMRLFMPVYVSVSVCTCTHTHVHACVHACVCMWVCAGAWWGSYTTARARHGLCVPKICPCLHLVQPVRGHTAPS